MNRLGSSDQPRAVNGSAKGVLSAPTLRFEARPDDILLTSEKADQVW
jgi:hypothetical protein